MTTPQFSIMNSDAPLIGRFLQDGSFYQTEAVAC